MSIETICPSCREEYDMRHPYCPACRFSKRVGRVLTEAEASREDEEEEEE